MNKNLLLFLILLATNLPAQEIMRHRSPLTKDELTPDTLVYPFINGVQMIEVDFISVYERVIGSTSMKELLQNQHEAASMIRDINEYIFRKKDGTISKIYNSRIEKKAYSTFLKDFSRTKSSAKRVYFASHFKDDPAKLLNTASSGRSFQSSGFYRICNRVRDPELSTDQNQQAVKYGLIDSLGNVLLEAKYDEVSYYSQLYVLAMYNGKWGLVNLKDEIHVPFAHEESIHYYGTRLPLLFKNEHHFIAMFDKSTGKTYPLEGYDKVSDEFIVHGYLLVTRDKKVGLVNLEGKEVLPVIYDRINTVNAAGCRFERCANVYINAVNDDVSIAP
jgi:hypothetical protein